MAAPRDNTDEAAQAADDWHSEHGAAMPWEISDDEGAPDDVKAREPRS